MASHKVKSRDLSAMILDVDGVLVDAVPRCYTYTSEVLDVFNVLMLSCEPVGMLYTRPIWLACGALYRRGKVLKYGSWQVWESNIRTMTADQSEITTDAVNAVEPGLIAYFRKSLRERGWE